jgi:DNA modification methylase
MTVITWRTERREVSQLNDYDKNPRKITKKGLEQLKASMDKLGYIDPIAINLDGTIIGGHARKQTLQSLKIKEVDVRVPDRLLTEDEVAEAIVRLNKNIAGEWDFDKLANNFEIENLVEWGFTPEELSITVVPTEGLTDEDAVPEAPSEPQTVLGDVWILGNHRVMCGDSTSIEAVERLMGGQKADMVFTDPPYGMSYGGGRAQGNHARNKRGGVLIKAHGEIIGDDKRGDDLVALVQDSIGSAKLLAKSGAAFYVCFPWRTYSEFEKAVEANGLEISACIVWNKKSIGLGNANYRPQHEFIFYCKGGAWFGDKAQSDVWEMSRGATGEYVHPTQKPVELIEKALNNSSKSGDLVIDCFGGSGSTLIACEKTGRHARLMELDPKYCDVIIKRWQEFTGKEAINEQTGHTFNTLPMLQEVAK